MVVLLNYFVSKVNYEEEKEVLKHNVLQMSYSTV